MGLASVGIDAEAGRKSGSFGVLDQGGDDQAGESQSKG